MNSNQINNKLLVPQKEVISGDTRLELRAVWCELSAWCILGSGVNLRVVGQRCRDFCDLLNHIKIFVKWIIQSRSQNSEEVPENVGINGRILDWDIESFKKWWCNNRSIRYVKKNLFRDLGKIKNIVRSFEKISFFLFNASRSSCPKENEIFQEKEI